MNEEIMKELNDALKMLSMITLSGDAVDLMAAAKQKIRKSMHILDTKGDKMDG